MIHMTLNKFLYIQKKMTKQITLTKKINICLHNLIK